MSRIPLSGGFTPIPEGTYVFRIESVEYKEKFGKLNITMKTQEGKKHIERFSLLDSKGNPNEGANNAFSYFAKTCMDDMSLTDIDPEDLIGRYIRCQVTHREVPKKKNGVEVPGEVAIFSQLGDKEPADGFDNVLSEKEVAVAEPAPEPEPKKSGNFDLDDILG